MVFRHALKNNKKFDEMAQILLNNRNLSRASAESVAFNHSEVCENEMKIGYTGMDKYSLNEIKYRRDIYTGMGLKNSSKINKNLEKLQLSNPLQRLLGIDGLLKRLELRSSLEKLSMMEFLGRKEDMEEFKKYVKMDCHDYKYCVELNDLIDSVCTRILYPNFDLTTCLVSNATYVARRNNIEEKEDARKVGAHPVGHLPPPASVDSHVYILDGKLNYNVNRNLKIVLTLVSPICQFYQQRRVILRNCHKGYKSFEERARAGEVIHVNPFGCCIVYNFPHWQLPPGIVCKCPPSMKFCLMCGFPEHGATKCKGFLAAAKPTKFDKDWPDTPIPKGLSTIFDPRYHIFKNAIRKGGNGNYYDNDNFARGSYRGKNYRGRNWNDRRNNRGNNYYYAHGGLDNNQDNTQPPVQSGNSDVKSVTIPPPSTKRRRT